MEEIRREQRLKDLKEKAKKEQAKALERDRRRKMDLKNQKRRDQREKGFGSLKKLQNFRKYSPTHIKTGLNGASGTKRSHPIRKMSQKLSLSISIRHFWQNLSCLC